MAQTQTGTTGTARFQDCACPACAAGKTHDAGVYAPEHVAASELARQNDPRRHDNAKFEPYQTLPPGASYALENIDGIVTVMHRRDAKATGGSGVKTGDAEARSDWQRATAVLVERNRVNAAHYDALAKDARRAVLGR